MAKTHAVALQVSIVPQSGAIDAQSHQLAEAKWKREDGTWTKKYYRCRVVESMLEDGEECFMVEFTMDGSQAKVPQSRLKWPTKPDETKVLEKNVPAKVLDKDVSAKVAPRPLGSIAMMLGARAKTAESRSHVKATAVQHSNGRHGHDEKEDETSGPPHRPRIPRNS